MYSTAYTLNETFQRLAEACEKYEKMKLTALPEELRLQMDACRPCTDPVAMIRSEIDNFKAKLACEMNKEKEKKTPKTEEEEDS